MNFKKKKPAPFINIEKIIKNDLFDTFIESIEQGPIKKSLIMPIPNPPIASISPPPQPKKQEFVNPLPIKLKGIVFSSDDLKSLAMIEDETQKEGLYHLGEKIKDAQVIKIAKNNIVILRANGQLEILSLRKEDDLLGGSTPTQPQEKWKYSIKKIDDFNFDIDPSEFKKETPSLSEMIEELSIGTAYEQGRPIGIKIGKIDPNEIGFVLGLRPNDIITSINNLNTIDIKDRMKIYDEITKLKKGNFIQVNLKRDNMDSVINYKLKKLDKPKKLTFISPATGQGVQPGLPQSKTQQQEQSIKDFQKQHNVDERRQQTIADIRKRLLEKLRQRSPNVRIR
ncbi:MAG: type II secretion system protein N [bacterium]